MRVACPATAAASIAVALFAWSYGRTAFAMIDSGCAGVNIMLAWINWKVFSL